MSLILPAGCRLPCLLEAIQFVDACYLTGELESFNLSTSIPTAESRDEICRFDRCIREIVAEREAVLQQQEGRRVRLIASVVQTGCRFRNQVESIFRVKILRAEDLMQTPTLRVRNAFCSIFPYRYAELAQSWDSLLNYVCMGEALDRAHADESHRQLFDVMRELFRLWSSFHLHYVKTYRYTASMGRRLSHTEEMAGEMMKPETRDYLSRRFPEERHVGWAALKMMEEGVRELHQLMCTELAREGDSLSEIRSAMDDSTSRRMVLYRGFPMNSNALKQLNRPCSLFGLLHEWTTMAHVAFPFAIEYGADSRDDMEIPCMQILELENPEQVAVLPIYRFATRTHELECLVSTPRDKPLQVVAATYVCTTGVRAGARLHFKQSRPFAPGELWDGFARAQAQFRGKCVLVLLMSPREENLEEAHQRLKRHCERLWGSEASASP